MTTDTDGREALVAECEEALDDVIGLIDNYVVATNTDAEAAMWHAAMDVLRGALKLGMASVGDFKEEADRLGDKAIALTHAVGGVAIWRRLEERMMIARMARDRRKGYAILDSYKDRVDEYDRVHFHNGAYDDDDPLETS